MREQAKKMNVKSLRSSEDCDKSAEGKLAKVKQSFQLRANHYNNRLSFKGCPNNHITMVHGLDTVFSHLLLWPLQDRGLNAAYYHMGCHICQDQRCVQSHCLWNKVSGQ